MWPSPGKGWFRKKTHPFVVRALYVAKSRSKHTLTYYRKLCRCWRNSDSDPTHTLASTLPWKTLRRWLLPLALFVDSFPDLKRSVLFSRNDVLEPCLSLLADIELAFKVLRKTRSFPGEGHNIFCWVHTTVDISNWLCLSLCSPHYRFLWVCRCPSVQGLVKALWLQVFCDALQEYCCKQVLLGQSTSNKWL